MKNTENNSNISNPLPSYKSPPVNEVVCGVQFKALDKLYIPHIGFIWEKFRKDYPRIQHAPPIALDQGKIMVDKATGIPLPRVWFINESDDQLIQFQVDRFYFNWRRRKQDYPRYSHVIKNFENVMKNIAIFFEENKLGDLKPIEYELTYINHIPKEEGWNTIDDLSEIFTDFIWKKKKGRFLPNPEKMVWRTEFKLPEKMGTLNINLKQAVRTEDKVPLFVLELKARGIDDNSKKESYREWFDLSHEWIVRGFTDLTTPTIHKFWERE